MNECMYVHIYVWLNACMFICIRRQNYAVDQVTDMADDTNSTSILSIFLHV